jgi:drug/metabolite transporter (DMT)-like permease
MRYARAEVQSLAILTAMFFYINVTAYVGTSWTTAGRATVFFYTQPLFLALLAPYFLPGDRLTSRKLCGLGLALCGIVALFFTKLSGREGSTLAVTFSFSPEPWSVHFPGLPPSGPPAVFILLRSSAGNRGFRGRCLRSCLGGWRQAVPLYLPDEQSQAILYLGVISAAFGFVAFAWLIQRNSATRVTALTFLAPVFGVAYSWFFFREAFTPLQLLGVLGVCLGVYIVNSRGAVRPSATVEPDSSVRAKEQVVSS